MQRRTGIVKFYDESKGFGFIIEDGTNEEFFFHHSDVMRTSRLPKKGDLVAFDLRQGKRVIQADAVEVI